MRHLALAALCLSTAGAAHALSLDFGNGPTAPTSCVLATNGVGPLTSCTNSTYIAQSYGDVAGAVDVTYSNTGAIYTGLSLRWWDVSYNNLYGVLWADGSDATSSARVEIKALVPGAVVTLDGFDLGAYPGTTRGSIINVYAIGGGAPLFSYTGNVGEAGNLATHFAPNVSAAGGLWIEWQNSAYNNGIDNISYSISAVPEPAAAALMLAGVAALVLSRQRRR